MSTLSVTNITGQPSGNFGVVNATSISTNTGTITALTSNTISANTMTDIIGNVRTLPINLQSSVYTITALDSGKIINTSANVTVNGAIFSNGQAVSVYNNSVANISIISGTGVTMYLGGTATTGTRTLAQKGVATLAMVDSNTFVISGAGLS